jgi:hypothetical protein
MIKLRVQYGRREGRPEFSSECAECSLELEVDGAMLEHPTDLHDRIGAAYAECRAAVDEQLRAKSVAPPKKVEPQAAPAPPPAPPAPLPPPAVKPPKVQKPVKAEAEVIKSGLGDVAYSPPENTRQFLGWFGEQSNTVRDVVFAIGRERGLGSLVKAWPDDDSVAVWELVAEGYVPRAESDHQRFMRRMKEKEQDYRAGSVAFTRGPG